MPMHPSPTAETSKPLFPSLRFFMTSADFILERDVYKRIPRSSASAIFRSSSFDHDGTIVGSPFSRQSDVMRRTLSGHACSIGVWTPSAIEQTDRIDLEPFERAL